MKILVTGGGGFLGSEICKQLLARGHKVSSFSRKTYSHLEEMGVRSFCGDLRDGKNLGIALEGVNAIIHTAALADIWGRKEDFYDINFKGTENLLKAAIAAKVEFLIYTSSPSVVFGQESIEGGNESMAYPDKYLAHYPASKARAEKLILASKELKTMAIRPHLIFGPNDPHIIPRLVAAAQKGRLKQVGNGDNLVDVIHVVNAAAAHIQALDALQLNSSLAGEAYFVAQERPVKLWDFINKILELKGLAPVNKSISYQAAFKIGGLFEIIYRVIGRYQTPPPMTRFLASQLGKSHYFSHAKAKRDFNFTLLKDLEEACQDL